MGRHRHRSDGHRGSSRLTRYRCRGDRDANCPAEVWAYPGANRWFSRGSAHRLAAGGKPRLLAQADEARAGRCAASKLGWMLHAAGDPETSPRTSGIPYT